MAQQRVADLREVLIIVQFLDFRKDEHRRYGLPLVFASQRVRKGAGDGRGLQFGIGQFAFGFGHLESDVEPFALGDHAVLFERNGILQVFAHAFDHLTAHLHDLRGESQSEVALYQFRDQCVAGLVALFRGALLVDLRGPVRGVDLAAHPDRERHLAAHEAQTPVLHFEEPVGVHHRVQQSLDALDDRRVGDQPAAEDFARQVLGRTFHVVEIESDVLGHVGIGARDVYLRHAEADGRAAFLLGRALLVGGGLHRGILREGDGDRLVEREHPALSLRQCERRNHRRRHEGDLDCFSHSFIRLWSKYRCSSDIFDSPYVI